MKTSATDPATTAQLAHFAQVDRGERYRYASSTAGASTITPMTDSRTPMRRLWRWWRSVLRVHATRADQEREERSEHDHERRPHGRHITGIPLRRQSEDDEWSTRSADRQETTVQP
jgi:hypothetical protein